ncbi:hypothetical protein HMPREF3188_01424 [Tissierellia bacterium KA00581]|nr:hypothetical protein HMPREF3188_01424 [Tissierellia bacterium KA00581]
METIGWGKLLGRILRSQKMSVKEKYMDNRKRKNQLKIYLTDEEKEIFEKKMKLANCKTMSHFLRKCVLEKKFIL